MRAFVLNVLVLFIFSACSDADQGPVSLRIKNNNDFDFDNIQINDQLYGEVEANSYSDYLNFSELYSYAYINANVNGKEYILQAVDFVGETPLPSANYTYQITTDTTQGSFGGISLTLIKE